MMGCCQLFDGVRHSVHPMSNGDFPETRKNEYSKPQRRLVRVVGTSSGMLVFTGKIHDSPVTRTSTVISNLQIYEFFTRGIVTS